MTGKKGGGRSFLPFISAGGRSFNCLSVRVRVLGLLLIGFVLLFITHALRREDWYIHDVVAA